MMDQVVSKSLIKCGCDLPPEKLKKFCLGLPYWRPCCIKGGGMAKKEINCDDAPGAQTCGKSLSLKRKRAKSPVALRSLRIQCKCRQTG